MSDADWISAREIIERLAGRSDHPEAAVLRCVAHHNCQSRAKALLLDGQVVASNALLFDDDDNQGLQCLRPRFWEKIVTEGTQDWKMGCFSYIEEAPSEHFGHGVQLNWQAAGVEFFWPEIEERLVIIGIGTPQGSFVRADLPRKMTPNDRKHAEFAHRAAEIIWFEAYSPEKAFELALGEATAVWKKQFSRKSESAKTAVRRVFKKMYDKKGQPVRNPVRKSQD